MVKENEDITMEALVTDPEEPELRSVIWYVDQKALDKTDLVLVIPAKDLGVGDHLVEVQATDSRGAVNVNLPWVEVTVLRATATNKPPVVEILSPLAGQELTVGEQVWLNASVTDVDGEMRGRNVWWSIDGMELEARGSILEIPTLDVTCGTHTIAVVAIDSDNMMTRAQVTIEGVPPNSPPELSVQLEPDKTTFEKGEKVQVKAFTLLTGEIKDVDWYLNGDLQKASCLVVDLDTASIPGGEYLIEAQVTSKNGLQSKRKGILIQVGSTCVDDMSWERVKKNLMKLDCESLTKQRRQRCGLEGVDGRLGFEACPEACGNDRKWRAEIGQGKNKRKVGCGWVKKKPQERCGEEGMDGRLASRACALHCCQYNDQRRLAEIEEKDFGGSVDYDARRCGVPLGVPWGGN